MEFKDLNMADVLVTSKSEAFIAMTIAAPKTQQLSALRIACRFLACSQCKEREERELVDCCGIFITVEVVVEKSKIS